VAVLDVVLLRSDWSATGNVRGVARMDSATVSSRDQALRQTTGMPVDPVPNRVADRASRSARRESKRRGSPVLDRREDGLADGIFRRVSHLRSMAIRVREQSLAFARNRVRRSSMRPIHPSAFGRCRPSDSGLREYGTGNMSLAALRFVDVKAAAPPCGVGAKRRALRSTNAGRESRSCRGPEFNS
jgi:hypothetical protein